MRPSPRFASLFAVSTLLSWPAGLSAQSNDLPAPEAGPEPSPPRLVEFVKATLPEGFALREPTAVVTALTVDETGRVVEASVVESAGAELDRAVLDAVRAFVFEPAQSGGKPVSVTIRYRYLVEPNVPPPAPAAVAPVPAAPALPAKKPAPAAPPQPPAGGELEEFTATAEVEAPPREVTKRSIDERELTRIPGTRGDALKAIEVLPGVARTSGFSDPLLRGAAWNESVTQLDGVTVPFLFHFGGLTSFMNSRLIERVDLYPSNYSTRFGRVTGGVVEVRARDPKTDALHGVLDLNLIDSSLLVEGPLGENTSLAVAARRSNLDFFFESFVPEDTYSVVAAPVYWDYQALLAHRFDSNHRLRLTAYGGYDSVELLFSEPSDEDPALTGQIGGSIQFHRVQAALESRLSPTTRQSLVAAVGYLDLEQAFGELVQEIDGPELHARAEWSFELLPELRLTTGAELTSWFAGGRYRGPQPGQTEGQPSADGPLASQSVISAELDDIDVIRPAAYVELGVQPVEPLLIVPGVRIDYYGDLGDFSFDPRLSTRYELVPGTTLKAGVGLYSQPPEYWQVLPGVGNPELEPYRALHTSAGVEQRFGEVVKLGIEGFYKRLENRVVATADQAPPRLVNDGEGRIVGGELSAEVRPRPGTFGYLAYTLSKSERRDLDGAWRPFDQDQTHILTAAAGHDLGAGWEIGARFRLVTGDPATPVVGSVYDARSGVYVPIYGPVNSERNPTFHQLDVRVEKRFTIGAGSLAIYLDLQNAYNAQNQEGVRYSYDYRAKEAVTGLPILPNLGLRGEL